MNRERQPERVELITGDPGAFGAREPTRPPATIGPSPRRVWLAVGAVAALLAVVWLVWPGSSPTAAPSTTTIESSVATTTTTTRITPEPVPTTSPGRVAHSPTEGIHVGLSVEPQKASLLHPVTVRLSGDLSAVAPTVAAIVWVDQLTDGVWRTVAWIAQVSDDAQLFSPVSEADAGPAPDAMFVPPDQGFDVSLFRLATGDYRLCRYVPLNASGTTTLPVENPAYVCAPVTVDNDVHPNGTPTS